MSKTVIMVCAHKRDACLAEPPYLPVQVGRAIARGEQPEIMPRHLTLVSQQSQGEFGIYGHKRCENCGYETDEDFEYCPKCGKRF